MSHAPLMRTAKVACDACDTWNEIRYQVDRAGQSFTCTKCGKATVRAPRVPAAKAEPADPKKPWALNEMDKRFLRKGLRITPE